MKTADIIYDTIIIGAGAAGMMCAIEAGKRGRKVLLLDHASKIGAKILISGGGRCNFTNKEVSAANYVSENPHFCKSALSRYTPDDFIDLVKKHGIPFHEKKLGQLFCDRSAQDIVNILVSECEQSHVLFQMETTVQSIEKKEEIFFIQTNKGRFTSTSLVIATGGLSIPKIGATDFGYRIAKKFGLKIISPIPALDGFVFSGEDQKSFQALAGISLDSVVTTGEKSFRENILFTHMGLSGPAALQASLYWNPGESIEINLSPTQDRESWLLEKKKSGLRMEMKNVLAQIWPERFAYKFCEIYFPESKPLFQISDRELIQLAHQIHHWKITPESTVGYRKAEVTRGGVSTEEISSKTMESKKVPGLYFIGEVVDVTGQLGGYNFQWAWSSGWAAGQNT